MFGVMMSRNAIKINSAYAGGLQQRGWAARACCFSRSQIPANGHFRGRNPAAAALHCSDANAIAQQALGNIRTVYAFNGEERTVEHYISSLDTPVKVSLLKAWSCLPSSAATRRM